MPESSSSAYQKIYIVVRAIPCGKVATYGQVADLAGFYGKARLVGYALYQVDPASDIPWQRVVNIKGEVSYSTAREGADYVQRNLLEQEGIVFSQAGKIDLAEYRWQVSPDFFDDVFIDKLDV
jgi:methylated-DNA-protein-cysteine methyltransferase related protein